MEARVLSVAAYGVAETLKPQALAAALGVQPVEVSKTSLLARFGDGWVAIQDFGAIVFVGVAEDEVRPILDRVKAAGGVRSTPHAETFALEVQPNATPSARFDRVVLPRADAPHVALVAFVVGQSVALEQAEADVDGLLAETDVSARRLSESGARALSSRALLPFVGRAMTTRTQAVHTLALLDAPAAAWESESLDRLHRALRSAFDIEERYRGLDHKLRVVQENLALLVDLAQHRSSTVLEVAVVGLILFEVVMGLVGRH